MADGGDSEQVLIKFAQKLAGNEKKYRDRSLKKFKKWLGLKCQGTEGGLSEEELQKIWKGLHYCMWMSDKPLVQEDLADELSKLVHLFKSPSLGLRFLDAFLHTEAREWHGIDNFRIDKFMMLVRRCWHQSLVLVKHNGYSEDLVSQLVNILQKTVLSVHNEQVPDGLRCHVADIYWPEMEKVDAENLGGEQIFKFIQPYCVMICETKNIGLLQRIMKRIFEPPLQWAAETLEESEDDSEKEEEQEGERMREGKETKPTRLKVPLQQVTDHLFQLASGQQTCLSRNRPHVYKLVKKYRLAAQGEFEVPPERPSRAELSKDPIKDEINNAAIRLQKFEERTLELNVNKKTKKQLKKQRKRKAKEALENGDDDNENDDEYESMGEEEKNASPPPAKKQKNSDNQENCKNKIKKSEKKTSLSKKTAITAESIDKGDVSTDFVDPSEEQMDLGQGDASPVKTGGTGSKKKKTKKGRKKSDVVISNESLLENAKADGINLSGGLFDSEIECKEKGKAETPVFNLQSMLESGDKKGEIEFSKKEKLKQRKSLDSSLGKQAKESETFQEKAQKRKSLESGIAAVSLHKSAQKDKTQEKAKKKGKSKKSETSEPVVNLFIGGFVDSDEEINNNTNVKSSEKKTNDIVDIQVTGETVILGKIATPLSKLAKDLSISNETGSGKKQKRKDSLPKSEATHSTPVSSPKEKEELSQSDKTDKKKKRKGGSGRYFIAEAGPVAEESSEAQNSLPTVTNETVTEDGEVEIWIPNKKYKGSANTDSAKKASKKKEFASFENLTKTPPAFVRKAVSKVSPKTEPRKVNKLKETESRTPGSVPDSKKRVSFIMARNTAQDFEDSFTASPKPLPFNPQLLPETSILKPSPANSPAVTPKQKMSAKEKRRSKAADFF